MFYQCRCSTCDLREMRTSGLFYRKISNKQAKTSRLANFAGQSINDPLKVASPKMVINDDRFRQKIRGLVSIETVVLRR